MTTTDQSDLRKAMQRLVPQTNCPESCDGYGTYVGGADEDGDPEPAQCQYCYEVRLPLIDAILSLVAAEVTKARIDELGKAYDHRNNMHWWYGDRLAELTNGKKES